MARNSKLTDKLVKEICQYIEQGNTYDRSCRLAGISDRVFYLWKAQGEKEKAGVHFQFFQSVKKAEEKFKQTNINLIQEAAKEGTWQAAAWLLERKHPEEFGRRDRVAISMDDKLTEFVTGLDSIK